MTSRLLPLNAIRPSTYNPRKADPRRLALVRMSLTKLGFVLPLIADNDGEIISGHQRHWIATQMGLTHVPVVSLPIADLDTRRALNIVFNRGTNDMSVLDHSSGMTRQLVEQNVRAVADSFPDATDMFPCLQAEVTGLEQFVEYARPRYDHHMRNMARALYNRVKLKMPIVATRSGRVVNGLGRVQYGMESGNREWPVVWVSEAQAEFTGQMLNLLSMDFDIGDRYSDLLRYNSFRRSRLKRQGLGMGFIAALPQKNSRTKDFDITDPRDALMWKRTYGRRVVDFGAGHLRETEMLRAAGVEVAAFEPFYIGSGNDIDRPAALTLTKEFLRVVSDPTRFDSVFVSSVMNSVPFRKDREHIVRLCAALCDDRTTFHVNAMTTLHPAFKAVTVGASFSERGQTGAGFALDYEPGIALGEFMSQPKVQKFHDPAEFYDLLKTGFEAVEVKLSGDYLYARCKTPKRDLAALREAIEFEFDLPYPDGFKMGLVAEAKAAFGNRLGVTL